MNRANIPDGPRGGRAAGSRLQTVSNDLIQERGFRLAPLEEIGECVTGEPVVDAVTDASCGVAVGITKRHRSP